MLCLGNRTIIAFFYFVCVPMLRLSTFNQFYLEKGAIKVYNLLILLWFSLLLQIAFRREASSESFSLFSLLGHQQNLCFTFITSTNTTFLKNSEKSKYRTENVFVA